MKVKRKQTEIELLQVVDDNASSDMEPTRKFPDGRKKQYIYSVPFYISNTTETGIQLVKRFGFHDRTTLATCYQ